MFIRNGKNWLAKCRNTQSMHEFEIIGRDRRWNSGVHNRVLSLSILRLSKWVSLKLIFIIGECLRTIICCLWNLQTIRVASVPSRIASGPSKLPLYHQSCLRTIKVTSGPSELPPNHHRLPPDYQSCLRTITSCLRTIRVASGPCTEKNFASPKRRRQMGVAEWASPKRPIPVHKARSGIIFICS